MTEGLPKEASVFKNRSLEDIYDEIREVYQSDPRPWVIGYSGGKDSTAVVQLIWNAVKKLKSEERKKPIFVIASDTGVENPIIALHIRHNLELINEAAEESALPFQATPVVPTLNDSFWVNLIGRGYPAPTSRFRWCTERLKIKPTKRFIQEKVSQYGEVIMVLGLRKSESATRQQLMSTYQNEGHVLRHHASWRGAHIYAPIADFSAEDVWGYLTDVRSPWGGDNEELATLYKKANAEERPMVIDTSTPPTGRNRFGCWICTLTEKDASMEALVDTTDSWMKPLLEFREWLNQTTIPEKKREYRDIRGRDGRIILKKDGTPAARTYKLEYSRYMLEKVLSIQEKLQAVEAAPNLTLISQEELFEIRRIWRTERQDWEDTVPKIYYRVTGMTLDCPPDDDYPFSDEHKKLLSSICREYEVPFELIARMLEAERETRGMARRAGIYKALGSELGRDWRSEKEILSAEPIESKLESSLE
jgi:DNA sulfur modification protein DndC